MAGGANTAYTHGMSLYRKYRPQTFDDVVDQKAVVSTLKEAVRQDKISHAYLFAGARGTGKTSMARILAKHILTRGIDDPTLKSQIIKNVEDGSLVDLIEIDAASTRGIDDMRNLIERIQFAPVVSKAKVYIVDEVHMLTREAFNALLKTLEEPPSYAYFILATTELHKIPPTIQSRCQKYVFRHIKDADIVTRLRLVADQETMTIDDDALVAIAHHAQGGLRDALSLLDQLRSLKNISAADVRERTGAAATEYGEAILDALDTRNREIIMGKIRQAEEAGIAMDILTRDLLARVRERMHAAVEDNLPIQQHVALIDRLLEAMKDLRSSPIPALALEAALLSIVEGSTQAPAHVPSPPFQETRPKPTKIIKEAVAALQEMAPVPPVKNESSGASLQEILTIWPLIVDMSKPASVKMSLKNGVPTDMKGDTLTVAFETQFHRERVMKDGTHGVEKLLEERLGSHVKLQCILQERAPVQEPLSLKEAVDLAAAAADVF